jgi:hypothetical protein
MEKPEITLSRYRRCPFLISGLLVSLVLSSGVWLAPLAQACDSAGQSEQSSLNSANLWLRDVALTTSPSSQAERPGRTRHWSFDSAVVAHKLSPLAAFVRGFAMGRDTSITYTSFRFSRPRGRAPPQLTW